jgi:hypothetical protein
MGIADEAGDFILLVGDEWLVEELPQRKICELHAGTYALLLRGCGQASEDVS